MIESYASGLGMAKSVNESFGERIEVRIVFVYIFRWWMCIIRSKPLGALLQDYEVLDLLGKGGFAKVYRARCLHSNNYVAIKMVSNGA